MSRTDQPAPLKLAFFGRFSAHDGERGIKAADDLRPLAKLLLAVIALEGDPHMRVEVDVVSTVLWGLEASRDESVSDNLNRTVDDGRRALEPETDREERRRLGIHRRETPSNLARSGTLLELRNTVADARQFDEAFEDCRYAEALHIATGPDAELPQDFLAGLNLRRHAVEARRWLDRTRGRYRGRILECLLQLASAAVEEGKHADALRLLQIRESFARSIGHGDAVETTHREITRLEAATRSETEPLESARAPAKLAITWHKIVPAVVGVGTTSALLDRFGGATVDCHGIDCRRLKAEDRGGGSAVYVQEELGVVLHHVSETHEAPSITRLAAARRVRYPVALSESQRYLEGLIRSTSLEAEVPVPPYLKDIFVVDRAEWSGGTAVTSALALLSRLSHLVPRDDGTPISPVEITRAELDEAPYLAAGFHDEGLRPFGQTDISVGYASWTAVAYYILDPARALPVEQVIHIELAIQALWAYCHEIILSAGLVAVPEALVADYQRRVLQFGRARLFGADAMETAPATLARQAILETSGLGTKLAEAIELIE